MTACGSSTQTIIVHTPPEPILSSEESVLYVCPETPKLGKNEESYEDILALALNLRSKYDTCKDLDSKLIDLSQHPKTSEVK